MLFGFPFGIDDLVKLSNSDKNLAQHSELNKGNENMSSP